eukprot:Opistho-2@50010
MALRRSIIPAASWLSRPLCAAAATAKPTRGINEFFEIIPPEESTEYGRSWKASELRGKSNAELHQLWYILLKERNLVMTMQHEARARKAKVPYKPRMVKVKKAMAAIHTVIGERENALRQAKDAVVNEAVEKAMVIYKEQLSTTGSKASIDMNAVYEAAYAAARPITADSETGAEEKKASEASS